MIELVSVEIANIRRVREAKFEPLPDGMTAINGAVGAGKSSLLTGLIWSLFGETPDGVPIKAMRRQGSEGQPCQAVVRFRHDGQLVEATRALVGRKDSTSALLSVDGVEVAKSSKDVTRWIVDRLGVDAEGFAAAFVVEQKQTDDLVKARPEARRALIERLGGIENLTKATKAARDEATEAKRALDCLPGSAEELADAERALEAAQVSAAALFEAAEQAREAAAAADAAANQAAAELAVAQDKDRTFRAAREAAVAARHAATASRADADRLAADTERLRAAAQGGDPAALAAAGKECENASAAMTAAEQTAERLQRAKDTAARERSRADELTRRADKAEDDARAAAQAAGKAKAAAVAARAEADRLGPAAAARAKADAAAENAGAARAEADRLALALRGLDGHGAATCPTCASDLADPAALKASLAADLDAAKAAADQAKADQQRWSSTADAADAADRAADRAEADARAAADKAEQSEQAATDAVRDAEQARESADEAETDADRYEAEAEGLDAKTDALRQAKAAAEQALRDAQRAADALAALPAAEQAASAAQDKAAQDKKTADDALVRQAELAVDDDLCPAAQKNSDTAAATARQAAQEAGRADGDARVAAQKAEQAEADRDRSRNRLKARADAFARWEEKTAVAEGLAAFRRDRLARLGPEMSEIATDLIAQLSDGEYVAVELDETFTPHVTHRNGEVRPVSMLSGGEESEVALALRLAIREIVAGQHAKLLFLDEPLTSQDKDKRAAVMAALRGLPGTQTIIINHASEATDMVDKVVHMVKDPDNGSWLAEDLALVPDDLSDPAGTVGDDPLGEDAA